MVEAFGAMDTGELGTETGQTGRLRFDTLPARLDRNRAAGQPAARPADRVIGGLPGGRLGLQVPLSVTVHVWHPPSG